MSCFVTGSRRRGPSGVSVRGVSGEEREELARLRDENARLRMEREILRKRGLLREGGRPAIGEA